ncbi:methyl-accepting chemotaxis protein [Methanosphaerula palustris]|uniref:Methyl-accepting chemotaxis sensory transducer with Pas/Pac sensor n=1 Tax=Methanosphaerula palustris (strain ATCC BAA-1556 / DSM 19958 / E1-9c) TaxID=521011 RepID=B8GE59_METPE|nr:methyl-accepting chemotaxis protein [Methanosphaerula palustris]ACL17560.1 methyl-accepting chemotaxis sensory transducer with Pas/Pac sensor [Methanosphaerula palustris E1-9c]
MAKIEQFSGVGLEESSFQHQQELQKVFDAIEVPIIRTDCDQHVLGLNRAASVFIGFKPEDCIGQTCDTLFNLNGSTRGRGTIQRAMTMAESQVADTVISPGGREIPIRFQATPLFDARGEVSGTINYLIRDLSEEKELLSQIWDLAGRLAAGDLDARMAPGKPDTIQADAIDAINGIVNLLAGQVQNITAQADLSRFFADEVAKVNTSICHLADGSLDLDLSIGPTDSTTARAGEQFIGINREIARVAASLTHLVSEIDELETAIVHGRFGVRAGDQDHLGVYRSAIGGVNTTLDALVRYFDQMPTSIFTIDNECRIQYINRHAAAIGGVSPQQAIGMPCAEVVHADACGTSGCVAQQCLLQHHNVKAETVARPRGLTFEIDVTGIPILDRHGQVVGSMEFIRDMTAEKTATRTAEKQALYQDREVKKVVEVLGKIAGGDLVIPSAIAPADEDTQVIAQDFDEINHAISQTVGNLNALVADATMLSVAAVEGRLATRADATRHQGDFRHIIEGVNGTLDELIRGLHIASDSVSLIGRGVIPERITAGMSGEFDDLKNNLNACIDGLSGLVEVNAVLKRMAVNDHSTEVKGNYPGLFGEVKVHVNTVRDRFNHIAGSIEKIGNGDLSEYQEYRTIGKRSEQDRLVPGLTRTLDHLQGLTDDAGMLARASVEGRLETRADASKHEGNYRKIVDGVNQTLDAVIAPLNEARRVSRDYAEGSFSTRMDRSIPMAGDFLEFREALDNIGVRVSAAIGAISQVSSAYAGCDFTSRVDPAVHLAGDFVTMGKALNSIGVEVSEAFRVTRDQIHDLNEDLTGVGAQVEEISRGAQQVAVSTIDVSANTEKAMLGTQQVLHAMEDISAAVEEVTASMESVAVLAKQTEFLSKDGVVLAGKAEASMDAIGNAGNEAGRIVNEIGMQMNDIGKIVKIIRELASQTNLLALNAAIEAARAGEHGRGFAVVAAEVKSLAQESRGSAEHIEELITGLRSRSEEALIAMNETSTLIEQGDLVLDETLQSFNKIVESVQKISQNTEEVASATEEQAAAVQEITASIHEVTSQIEETSRDSTDVASATEESTASIEEISRMIGEAKNSSERIRGEIAIFRV